ncbi:MAG: hypothetical protein SF069_02945 [Phycisphaerae bacterium]|nr:hypothetical protein [Phycisphaerae bacterium]
MPTRVTLWADGRSLPSGGRAALYGPLAGDLNGTLDTTKVVGGGRATPSPGVDGEPRRQGGFDPPQALKGGADAGARPIRLQSDWLVYGPKRFAVALFSGETDEQAATPLTEVEVFVDSAPIASQSIVSCDAAADANGSLVFRLEPGTLR